MNYPRGIIEWNGKALISMAFNYPGNKVGVFTAENTGIASDYLAPYGLQCLSEPTTGGLAVAPTIQVVSPTVTPLSVVAGGLTIGVQDVSGVIFREATIMFNGGAPE